LLRLVAFSCFPVGFAREADLNYSSPGIHFSKGLSEAEDLDGDGRSDFEAVAGGTESFEKVSKQVEALAKISGPCKRSAVSQEKRST